MNTGAIIMFAFGATLLWGGLAVTLVLASLKSKNVKESYSEDVSI